MLAALASMAMYKRVYIMYSMTSCVQGELGDCWLLVAMANMAMNKRAYCTLYSVQNVFYDLLCAG